MMLREQIENFHKIPRPIVDIFHLVQEPISETLFSKLGELQAALEIYYEKLDHILALLPNYVIMSRKKLEDWLKAEQKLDADKQSIAENVLKTILGDEL